MVSQNIRQENSFFLRKPMPAPDRLPLRTGERDSIP